MSTKQRLSRWAFCALTAAISGFTLSLLLLSVTSAAAMSSTGAEGPEASTTISGTVTLWYPYGENTGEEKALRQVITDALAAHPDLAITAVRVPFDQLWTRYETEVSLGGGPDLFIFPNDSLGNQARANLIRDLDADLQGRLTNVTQTAVDGMKVNGRLYGVPESATAVGLYYNRSTVSNPPVTTTDLLSLLQSGKKLASTAIPYFFYGFWGAFGGQLMDADGRCIADRGGFAPGMQYLLDLQAAGAMFTDDYSAAQAQFLAGTADMLINGPWVLADYQAALGDNVGVVPLPGGPVGVARPFNGIDGFYINPNTHNFASTLELALFMTNQASSQVFADLGGHVPVRSDVVSVNPLLNAFAQASAQGFPWPQNVQFGNFWEPFGLMVSDVLGGAISPGAGVINACNAMNRLNGFPVGRLYLPLVRR